MNVPEDITRKIARDRAERQSMIIPAYAVLSVRQLRNALKLARAESKKFYNGRVVSASTITLHLEVDTSPEYEFDGRAICANITAKPTLEKPTSI